MTTLKITSFSRTEDSMLYSAPNVDEAKEIAEVLSNNDNEKITELNDAEFTVLYNYRGRNLYCNGGVIVYRTNPLTSGANGCNAMASKGIEEDVDILTADGLFRGRAIFY